MDICRTFINNLCSVIKEQNLKVSDIEKSVGVSSGYISRLKKSNGSFSLETAYKLANSVGKSIDDLIGTKESLLKKKIQIETELKDIIEKLDSFSL